MTPQMKANLIEKIKADPTELQRLLAAKVLTGNKSRSEVDWSIVKNVGANSSFFLNQRVLDSMYRNRRRLATGCAMLVAAALGYFAVAGENGITVYKRKRTEDRQLARQIETMKQENSQLQAHIERLKSDPEEIEHEARARFHYTKPGEVIYTLPDAPASNPSGAPSAPAPSR